MDDTRRLAEIAAYRAMLTVDQRKRVDYVVSHVAGITVHDLREMIEAGHSMEVIKRAVEGARTEEPTLSLTLFDGEDGIEIEVNLKQYERIKAMSKERVEVLAKTLRQRAAAKEREARAAQREQERAEAERQAGMTKRQKEEDENDGWGITRDERLRGFILHHTAPAEDKPTFIWTDANGNDHPVH